MQRLLDELRVATRDAHERLHVHPALRELTSETLTLAYYRRALQRFYGFYRPYEQLYAASGHPLLLEFPALHNLNWLAEDLARLAVDVSELPLHEVPEPGLDHEQVIAYLYLREGSNLGGKLISKHLESQLALRPGDENRFFWSHGAQTAERWRLFKDRLCSCQESTDLRKTAHYACILFARFERWFHHHHS